jgi:hypothetical protein
MTLSSDTEIFREFVKEVCVDALGLDAHSLSIHDAPDKKRSLADVDCILYVTWGAFQNGKRSELRRQEIQEAFRVLGPKCNVLEVNSNDKSFYVSFDCFDEFESRDMIQRMDEVDKRTEVLSFDYLKPALLKFVASFALFAFFAWYTHSITCTYENSSENLMDFIRFHVPFAKFIL